MAASGQATFRRISWMQTMITHSQNSEYGANQISPYQANRTRISPTIPVLRTSRAYRSTTVTAVVVVTAQMSQWPRLA